MRRIGRWRLRCLNAPGIPPMSWKLFKEIQGEILREQNREFRDSMIRQLARVPK